MLVDKVYSNSDARHPHAHHTKYSVHLHRPHHTDRLVLSSNSCLDSFSDIIFSKIKMDTLNAFARFVKIDRLATSEIGSWVQQLSGGIAAGGRLVACWH